MIGIFIEQPTPFLEEFFHRIDQLEYPKKKIDLFIHNADDYHDKHIEEFLLDVRKSLKYLNLGRYAHQKAVFSEILKYVILNIIGGNRL